MPPKANHLTFIDGLRGIAILLVVAYHIGLKYLPGGFIGVDIFFVISGYLISSLIYADLKTDRFNFRTFLARRIARLMPAFYLVIIACSAAGYFFLLAEDFNTFSESRNAVISFWSNIYFWQFSSGYFAQNSEELPLLHFWSLSLEQQFYLFFPILISQLWLYSKKLHVHFLILLVITLVGSMFSIWGSINAPSASFFLLPTRLCEFLLGAIIGLKPNKKIGVVNSSIKAEFATYLCLGIILLVACTIDNKTTFPGLLALIPSIATALIIYLGQTRSISEKNVLNLKPLVFMGLISYSIYLWHWPFIAFFNYLRFSYSFSNTLLLILSFSIVAVMCWRYIETPLRKKYRNSLLRATIYFILLPILLIFILHAVLPDIKKIEIEPDQERTLLSNGWCHASNGNQDANRLFDPKYLSCKKGSIEANAKKAILFGDSTAGHYEPFLHEIGKAFNISFTVLSTNSCNPSLKETKSGVNAALCSKLRDHFLKELKSKSYDIIFLSNRWQRPSTDWEDISDVVSVSQENTNTLVLLPQSPEFIKDMAQCYKIKSKAKYVSCSERSTTDYMEANEKLQNLANLYSNSKILNIHGFFDCNQNHKCSAFSKSGELLYADSGHLNIKASIKLANWYLQQNQVLNFNHLEK